ncbi:ATP-binding protein [Ciceribacter sp. L1K22]|uniref:sensor histidine kinase n=1 Tax=Ciceribacter sp. L1K22 TaxID=2820275 RepID=UPI001ABE3DD5|nr:ATP-binding protein [Ciceribacter sp. L1K22]MBO3758404.1 histidine kinase [Ciceribacter sp. L1K22]
MSETEAAASVERHPSLRKALLYLPLQLIAVLAAVLFFSVDLPLPSETYRLGAIIRSDSDGREHDVALPDLVATRDGDKQELAYTATFERPAQSREVWSIFIPRFIVDVRVLVNGVEIGDTGADPSAGKAQLNLPFLTIIPDTVLRPGPNEVQIALISDPPIAKHLEAIYAGPDRELRPSYNARLRLFQTLPLIFFAWRFLLALLLGMIWLSRRKETAYGLLALALVAGVIRNALFSFGSVEAVPLIGVLIVVESVLVVPFALAQTGYRSRWWWLLLAPAPVFLVAGFIGDERAIQYSFLLLGPPTVMAHAVIVWSLFTRSAIEKGDGASFLMGTAMTIVMAGMGHDLLALFNLLPGGKYFYASLSYSAILIAFGTLLAARFVQALNRIDGFANQLMVKITEAEQKLRQSFAREQARDRAEALAQERDRLMRDLHDGLGGQLVRIVALSERHGSDTGKIGEAARAALKDLRLVIDAMEDVDGDLLLALASWRERTDMQLRAHQITLDWQVRTTDMNLTFPELRPWHVIQIVRLMDEAVTNAVKHAVAKTISVILRTAEGAEGAPALHITIRDDGRGFDQAAATTASTGFGLSNMRKRAMLCGATLTIDSGPYGTAVDIALPRIFPATPGSG